MKSDYYIAIINGLQKYSFSLDYQIVQNYFFYRYKIHEIHVNLSFKQTYYSFFKPINMNRIGIGFYMHDAVYIAEKLLGKVLVRVYDDGTIKKYRITETEAYHGEDDLACHASKGRTPRTEIMYATGGHIYVYLIYGMYWMLNVVTGNVNHPQAVLIRGIDNIIGSGKVGRELKIDKSFYGEDLRYSKRIWIEYSDEMPAFETLPRVGIDYAGDEWKNKLWRFALKH
jgi:DNA-3-methyladenine glycosylase